jgi:rhomboid protease GluP
LFSYWFSPNFSVGASGAIFGLVGALLAVAISSNSYGFLTNLVLVIVLNFAISLSPGSRIDNWGHLGGLVAGFILGFALLAFRSFAINI